MSKVGCVIIEDFKRPDKALVEKFRNVAVANLDDCMNRISAVHEDIRPVNKGNSWDLHLQSRSLPATISCFMQPWTWPNLAM